MSPASPAPSQQPVYEDFSRCVHCGLCLNHCPTYRLWQQEADSPRGRIRQMLLVHQGEIPISHGFVKHIDNCLDCRSCETACPSGVSYGKLVEDARARIELEYQRPLLARAARNFAYRRLLPFPKRIASLARLLWLYQRSGLQRLVRTTGLLHLLGLADRELLLPAIDTNFFYQHLGKTFPAQGSRRARVALFAGCIANVAFTKLHEATIRVLTANGCEVIIPHAQVCCGALPSHAGVRDVARELARRNLAAFDVSECDAIVSNAAGCGSTLKEYSRLFSPSEPEHALALAFEAKARDVTEFLSALVLVSPLRAIHSTVTYQDSCHLLHAQKIREAPRNLLRAIPGLNFVELPSADICCGSAGVYNVTHPAASLDLLADKMSYAAATKASIIATANPGCLLQLRAGAALHNTGQEVLHVIELLDRAIS